jgi:hypothetical protein
MKKVLVDFSIIIGSFLVLSTLSLDPVLASHRKTNRWKGKVNQIETLLKSNQFISLPQGGAISPLPVTQELWVEVMGNNPSQFKEKKHCPETYKEIKVDGKSIGMCPDFAPDRILAVSRGKKDSDLEFIQKLNQIYKNAGLKTKFRRQTRKEFAWADTAGEKAPKSANDPLLKKFTPYREISNQPRSIMTNEPNTLGFRRSGSWEWAQDKDGSYQALVGGSWFNYPAYVASGFRYSNSPRNRSYLIGSSRLVRIKN